MADLRVPREVQRRAYAVIEAELDRFVTTDLALLPGRGDDEDDVAEEAVRRAVESLASICAQRACGVTFVPGYGFQHETDGGARA